MAAWQRSALAAASKQAVGVHCYPLPTGPFLAWLAWLVDWAGWKSLLVSSSSSSQLVSPGPWSVIVCPRFGTEASERAQRARTGTHGFSFRFARWTRERSGDHFRYFLEAALGVRGEEGAGANERRWDGDGVRWDRGLVGKWVGGVFC